MPRRFRDAGQSIYTFGDTFLVRCPRCDRQAEVISLPSQPELKAGGQGLFAPRGCVCAHCGYVKEWYGKRLAVGSEAADWYFGYPLWLQTPCCGQKLWAYNEPHLRFLEEFVAADLRERPGLLDELPDERPDGIEAEILAAAKIEDRDLAAEIAEDGLPRGDDRIADGARAGVG